MNCTHCGRKVEETTHAQKSYQVDYFLMLTGKTEEVIIKDPLGGGEETVFQKLIEPRTIVTCVDCWRHPKVKAALQECFKE